MHSLERGVDNVSIEPLHGFHRQLVIEIYPIIMTTHHNLPFLEIWASWESTSKSRWSGGRAFCFFKESEPFVGLLLLWWEFAEFELE